MDETRSSPGDTKRRTALKVLVVALTIVASAAAAASLEDGARTVEIVGLWGAAFAAGVSLATLVSGIRRDRAR